MKRDLLKNTIIIAIGKFGTQVLSYFLLPIYTSILTTTEYGTYDLLFTICIFLVPLITIMIEESMFRFLIDEETMQGKRKVLSTSILFAIISTIIWCTVGFIILSIINYEYKIVFMLYIISSIIMKLTNGISRGMSKIKLYSLSNFILSFLTIALNILFVALFKWGVKGLLYSTIIANVLTGIFVLLKIQVYDYIKPKYFDKKSLKTMLKYSFPLVPNNISWNIINISDRIIITSFLGSSMNGIYAVANKFPSIMDSISSFFFTAFKENAAIAIKKDNYERYYNSIYDTIHKVFISISLLIITILPFVFHIFIKNDYIEAYKYIPILVISVYYGNMSGFYGSLFTAFKESKTIGKSTMIGAGVNLVVHLSLIYFIGIYAAIISTLVSNFIVYIYRKYKIKNYTNLHKIKNYYFAMFVLLLVTIMYYINKPLINIISLILAIVYIVIANKLLINDIKKIIKAKMQKK